MEITIPLNKDIKYDTLLEIAQRRFPQYNSYIKYTAHNIRTLGVTIPLNFMCEIEIKLKHNNRKKKTTIKIKEQYGGWITILLIFFILFTLKFAFFLGLALIVFVLLFWLFGGLRYLYRSLIDEIEKVFLEELEDIDRFTFNF